jgi:4-hydroxybenzoate polyprenyltransferase
MPALTPLFGNGILAPALASAVLWGGHYIRGELSALPICTHSVPHLRLAALAFLWVISGVMIYDAGDQLSQIQRTLICPELHCVSSNVRL